MKKILTLLVLGILLVFGAGAFIKFRNQENGVKYRTARVTRGDIETAVKATGTVNAVTTVLVGTQVSGTIKAIYSDFNSPVKKGQIIALIDPATFDAQVEQAKANLYSARANLEKAEATLNDAKRTLNINRDLFSKKILSKNEFDTSETNHEVARAQVSVSKAQIAQAQAALKSAEINLKNTRILSPVEGITISRNVDVGQTVAASFQTPTLFTIAQDLTKMQIDTNVGEADIGRITVDQDAEFTVDAYPDTTFRGTVAQVRNAPITVQNVVTYDVVIKVDNSEMKLKPGMTANVSIIIEKKNGVLRVPNAALRFKPAEEGKPAESRGGSAESRGPAVWTLENDKPKRFRVAKGINDDQYTEVISKEIHEGQEVIIEYLAKPKGDSQNRGPRFF